MLQNTSGGFILSKIFLSHEDNTKQKVDSQKMSWKESEKVNKATRNENLELRNLKKKCNGLLDLVTQLKNEKSRLEKELAIYKRESTSLNSGYEKTELEKFISCFEYIVKKSDEAGAFIPYTYSSKYAKSYMKIDCKQFESIIKEVTGNDANCFLTIGDGMQLLCRRPVSWSGKKMYLVSKSACEFILAGKSEDQEEMEMVNA